MKKVILMFIVAIAANVCTVRSQDAIFESVGVDPEHVCFPGRVYSGPMEPAYPLESMEAIERRLNQKVVYAREHPDLIAQPAVAHAVNCRGEIGGGFYMATFSGVAELDKELISFFAQVERWNPAEQDNLQVDSWYIWRLVVRNGYIAILNER